MQQFKAKNLFNRPLPSTNPFNSSKPCFILSVTKFVANLFSQSQSLYLLNSSFCLNYKKEICERLKREINEKKKAKIANCCRGCDETKRTEVGIFKRKLVRNYNLLFSWSIAWSRSWFLTFFLVVSVFSYFFDKIVHFFILKA